MINRGLAFINKTIVRTSESRLITINRPSNIVDNPSLQCNVLYIGVLKRIKIKIEIIICSYNFYFIFKKLPWVALT